MRITASSTFRNSLREKRHGRGLSSAARGAMRRSEAEVLDKPIELRCEGAERRIDPGNVAVLGKRVDEQQLGSRGLHVINALRVATDSSRVDLLSQQLELRLASERSRATGEEHDLASTLTCQPLAEVLKGVLASANEDGSRSYHVARGTRVERLVVVSTDRALLRTGSHVGLCSAHTRTSSIATSPPRRPTGSGSPTSRTCRPGRDGCISSPSRTSTRGGSS